MSEAYSSAILTDIFTANYAGDSGLPWWALTVILLLSFIFTALYGILSALIGFQSQTVAFYEMITGMSGFNY